MKNIKKILSIILVAVFLLSFSVYHPLLSAGAQEDKQEIIFDSIDISSLKDGEFDLDTVVVIIKEAYSGRLSKFDKGCFSVVENQEVKKTMDADLSTNEAAKDIYTIKLKKSGRDEVRRAIEKLQKRKEILYAGPNLKIEMQGQYYPDDPYLQSSNNRKPYENISLPQAWEITTGSRDIVVANNEAIQYDHEDLAANIWDNPNPTMGDYHGYNFNDPNGDIYPKSENEGHGTITAGVIGAVGDNGLGTSGISPKVSLMAVMASGSAQFSQLINYLNQHKAEIFNISLGWSTSEDPVITQSFLNYNGLVTISAGNGTRSGASPLGFDLDNPPENALYTYPALYSRLCPNVLAVANVDNNDNLKVSSNYGVNSVAIAAPSAVQTTNIFDAYYTGSGTSCSSPVVAGAAALIKSVVPSLSWQQVKAALLDNVDVIPSLVGKVKNGGRLNVYKAIKSVTVENGSYHIRNVATGKYLEATTDNASISSSFFEQKNSQSWKITNRGNHYYTISPNSNLAKYWDVYNAWDTENNRIGLFQKNDAYARAQSYQFVKNSDGTYRIIPKLSSTRCVSITTAEEAQPHLATINENDLRQKWVLERFETLSGTYFIRNQGTGQYLDAAAPSYENLIQSNFIGGDNEKFIAGPQSLKCVKNNYYLNKGALYDTNFYRAVTNSTSTPIYYLRNSDGSYCILRYENNVWKALDVYRGSYASGAVIGWYSYQRSANQRWYFEEGGQSSVTLGTYYIKNKYSGHYLDLKEATGGLLQHGFNGGKNQQWEISRTGNGNYKLRTKSTACPGAIGFQNTDGVYKAVVQNSTGTDIGIYKNSNGTYRLMMAGYSYSLVVRNASLAANAEVIWYPYKSSMNDQWELIPA